MLLYVEKNTTEPNSHCLSSAKHNGTEYKLYGLSLRMYTYIHIRNVKWKKNSLLQEQGWVYGDLHDPWIVLRKPIPTASTVYV